MSKMMSKLMSKIRRYFNTFRHSSGRFFDEKAAIFPPDRRDFSLLCSFPSSLFLVLEPGSYPWTERHPSDHGIISLDGCRYLFPVMPLPPRSRSLSWMMSEGLSWEKLLSEIGLSKIDSMIHGGRIPLWREKLSCMKAAGHLPDR